VNSREEQKSERRAQILTVALDQFVTKGFYGTSTRAIARIAGISSGLMFHYFDSKESLYEELLRIGCEKIEMNTDNIVATPLQLLQGMASEFLKLIGQNHNSAKMFVFMGNAEYNTEISPKVNELLARRNIFKATESIIEKGQRLGELRPGNPKALAVAFLCSIQGIAEQIALNPELPLPETEWIVAIIKKH
jgi:AcrR family transcriptional regulator